MSENSDRRNFFRSAFLRIAEPISEIIDDQFLDPPIGDRNYLRPPGALSEDDFLSVCSRSGKCVEACPAMAIFPLNSPDPRLDGTPMIDPDQQPCVVCTSLACMAICPSGALRSVEIGEIAMGLAIFDHDFCLNAKGIDCRHCVEACPIGDGAIRWNGKIEVISEGCIGCGVCQHQCPTDPKAITVQPNRL